MKRKVLTGLAALALSASLPLTNAVSVLADETQESTETITETAPQEKKERPAFKAEKGTEEMPQTDGEKTEFSEEGTESFKTGKPGAHGRHRKHRRMSGEAADGETAETPEGERKRKPGRRSDEEAVSEGNPAPELPEDAESGATQRPQKKSDEEALSEGDPAPQLPEGASEI